VKVDKLYTKLQKDYERISKLKDTIEDKYLSEFLHGKMDYIEMLIDWVALEEEME
jgi:hypothetical protein